jgi:hypothetical protein
MMSREVTEGLAFFPRRYDCTDIREQAKRELNHLLRSLKTRHAPSRQNSQLIGTTGCSNSSHGSEEKGHPDSSSESV